MTDQKALANWLLRLVPLDALTAYLVAQGWQQQAHPNRRIAVYTKDTIAYADGSLIEMVLPAAQTWDWPSYRETAVALLAAVEDCDEIDLVAALFDLSGDAGQSPDISILTGRFTAANPPAGSVPF